MTAPVCSHSTVGLPRYWREASPLVCGTPCRMFSQYTGCYLVGKPRCSARKVHEKKHDDMVRCEGLQPILVPKHSRRCQLRFPGWPFLPGIWRRHSVAYLHMYVIWAWVVKLVRQNLFQHWRMNWCIFSCGLTSFIVSILVGCSGDRDSQWCCIGCICELDLFINPLPTIRNN